LTKRRLISDPVRLKEVLAMEYENKDVDRKWSDFGRPCLDITSKYAMRIG
jgi:hypothetical protein